MARQAPCLMVQGTGSGVGKSLLTAALCRLFARAGYRVTPFKAQNMALNAAVADGGEIGRAQAAQAEAAGVEPTVDMNPILLKPESDHRSQVIVRGRPLTSADWGAYREMQGALLGIVTESLERLRRTFELVLIEGAGSPAEINLRAHDIVNMRVARLADARVLLVGDIDRGGVFAALVGTLALLDPADRARVAGLIVNKLRGDGSILTPGLDELAARTGVPVLGVVPWIDERLVPAEDSLDLEALALGDGSTDAIEIAVVRLPRIANFDDFEPLAGRPGGRGRARPPAGHHDLLAREDDRARAGPRRRVGPPPWGGGERARGVRDPRRALRGHAMGAASVHDRRALRRCGRRPRGRDERPRQRRGHVPPRALRRRGAQAVAALPPRRAPGATRGRPVGGPRRRPLRTPRRDRRGRARHARDRQARGAPVPESLIHSARLGVAGRHRPRSRLRRAPEPRSSRGVARPRSGGGTPPALSGIPPSPASPRRRRHARRRRAFGPRRRAASRVGREARHVGPRTGGGRSGESLVGARARRRRAARRHPPSASRSRRGPRVGRA